MPRCAAALILLAGLGSGLAAQTAPSLHRSHLEGKWQAKTADEIRNIMVRADSSAQFGEQVARWRIVGDSLRLALGGRVGEALGSKPAAGSPPPPGGVL